MITATFKHSSQRILLEEYFLITTQVTLTIQRRKYYYRFRRLYTSSSFLFPVSKIISIFNLFYPIDYPDKADCS